MHLFRVVSVALVVVALAEAAARRTLGDDSDWAFWSRTMAAKVDALERVVAQEGSPDVLFVGDSSAAMNFSPHDFDEASGMISFNLGAKGNFAESFEASVVRGILPEVGVRPKVYVASFSAMFFPGRKPEEEMILSSPYVRMARGERVWAEHLTLARIPQLVRLSRTEEATATVVRARGFEPYEEWVSRFRECQECGRDVPPLPAALAEAATAGQGEGRADDEEPVLPDPERVRHLESLFEFAERQGAKVVMILPPGPNRHPNTSKLLEELCDRYGAAFWDYEGQDRWDVGRGVHLTRDGARRFSRVIGKRVRQLEGGAG